ncbi:branched-chain amino acid aminotransferase [Sporosarcina sp. Te-1]|uniref:branched-chain amino acid aminotransferase n=1 Tax=Sporosarcina sp. Te-1 TaxID=2818390 RepID=UPI001A9D8D0B|nr:branched-chain amino acid aminotransferase [Sporosarcina sp. Te-1]QTD42609.1 branched-chain amino acid aminotransferase [Sporosarcina sp. Te-1]
MLKKRMEERLASTDGPVSLFPIEKEYALRHGLISNQDITDKEWRFQAIERCLKETEEMVQEESERFLDNPISILHKPIEEFLYVESDAFQMVKVEGIALEVDDVFKVYTALFGLQLQKKWQNHIQSFMDSKLPDGSCSLLFDSDGTFSVNISLNGLDGFDEKLPIRKVVPLIYKFLFELLETFEAEN